MLEDIAGKGIQKTDGFPQHEGQLSAETRAQDVGKINLAGVSGENIDLKWPCL